LIASWAAGWLVGGPEPDTRKALTRTASLRNIGVGLVIATGSFAATPAVTAADFLVGHGRGLGGRGRSWPP
jgi:BASS family bile acid:Na+ symporter